MHHSIDFGASTIDLIIWEGNKITSIHSYERSKFLKKSYVEILNEIVGGHYNRIPEIFVTGGKSRNLNEKFNNIDLIKVSEIEAIAKGGSFLIKNQKKFKKDEKFLIVSMGTGTCMVKTDFKSERKNFRDLAFEHVGGTGVGGGTFLGLCQQLLKETDIKKIINLFKKGDKGKVDLTVLDIVGAGIGIVPSSATASNLGKLSREIDFSKADLAAGIANLIGQTIAITSIFCAKSYDIEKIILTGKLIKIEKIMDVILETGKIYNMEFFIPDMAEFVSGIGAGVD